MEIIKNPLKKVSKEEFKELEEKMKTIEPKNEGLRKYVVIKSLIKGEDVEKVYNEAKKMYDEGRLFILCHTTAFTRLGQYYKVEMICSLIDNKVMDINEKIISTINEKECFEILKRKVCEKRIPLGKTYLDKGNWRIIKDFYNNYYFVTNGEGILIPHEEAYLIKTNKQEKGKINKLLMEINKKITDKINGETNTAKETDENLALTKKITNKIEKAINDKIEKEIDKRVKNKRKIEREIEINLDLSLIPHTIVFINEKCIIIRVSSGELRGTYFYSHDGIRYFMISKETARNIMNYYKEKRKDTE